MNKNVLYLTDDSLYWYSFKYKKIFKTTLPKDIVINGKVANINRFISKLEKFLKSNNLNSSILGDKIKIVVQPKYTSADISLLKNIFLKLNYRVINIESETKYYKLTEKNAWLNIFNNYTILTFINEYKRIENYCIENDFFDNKNDFYNFVKNKVNDKDVFLIGNNKEKIEDFYDSFENNFGNKTYMFANSEYCLLNWITNL